MFADRFEQQLPCRPACHLGSGPPTWQRRAAGWTLLFIIFVRELAISILLYSSGNKVLSVLICNRWVEGDHGVLAAMAVLQVLIMVVVLITVAHRIFRVDLARSAA